MSLFLSWIGLGILFLIAEIFFLTWDFLALGISALLTWFIVKFVSFGFINSLLGSSLIFLVSSILVWLLIKKVVYKVEDWNIPTTVSERIVWQTLIVQQLDGKKVVFFEGIYFPIINESEVKIWDSVKVVSFENNKVRVEKVI